MPFTECPVCGMRSHLNVRDPPAFERANLLKLANGYTAGICIYCFRTAKRGSRVKLWRIPLDAGADFKGVVGVEGTVVGINGDPQGVATVFEGDVQRPVLPLDLIEIEYKHGTKFVAPRDCVHVF